MNRPSTAKEALIAEALGDLATLIERVEKLAPALDASRKALVLSHEELVNEVAIFKTQMAKVISSAKVETSEHIKVNANDVMRKLSAMQTDSMKTAGREMFREEITPVTRQVVQQLRDLAERQGHYTMTLWSYAVAVMGGCVLTAALALLWDLLVER